MIVAIIGPDGCGKTTQADLLVRRLQANGYAASYVRPVYHLLDLMGLDRSSILPSPRKSRVSKTSNNIFNTVLKFFMAIAGIIYAYASFIAIKIQSRTKTIICDRYFYQYIYDLFGEFAIHVIKVFPLPDITFFLQCDIDKLYDHMNSQFDATVSRDYYIKVLELLNEIASRYNFQRIDATLERETISNIIFSVVENNINKGVSPGE